MDTLEKERENRERERGGGEARFGEDGLGKAPVEKPETFGPSGLVGPAARRAGNGVSLNEQLFRSIRDPSVSDPGHKGDNLSPSREICDASELGRGERARIVCLFYIFFI